MGRTASIGVALLQIVASVAPASAAGEFTSGRWNGQAFFDGGRFTHCAMLAPYVSRWNMLFSVDRFGEVSLGLASEQVEMFPGTKASIWLQIDNEPVVIREFTAVKTQLVVTKFPGDAEWLAHLRKGRKLKVNVGKRVPNFDLEGLNEALTALLDCAARNNKA